MKKLKYCITACVLLYVFTNQFIEQYHNNLNNIIEEKEILPDTINKEQTQAIDDQNNSKDLSYGNFNLKNIDDYNSELFININDGIPFFTKEEIITEAYESYSGFDELGRVQKAMACIGPELMPYDERESISHVKISGMEQKKYDIVDGNYLYNRSHLIGFQLTGENDNIYNLMTGTRYFNVNGMLPFENIVANYVTDTFNHVMYRVTPYFENNDLVAKGVLMEGYSVEDNGQGVSFNVFVYNVQPGVNINYTTGDSSLVQSITNKGQEELLYIINKNSRKYHLPNCKNVSSIKEKNSVDIVTTEQELNNMGYTPCQECNN